MRKLVTCLIAAMLLVQALVGCCRHGDSQRACCEAAAGSHALAVACCDAHEAPPCQERRPLAPHDCRLGCKSCFVSLPPKQSQLGCDRGAIRCLGHLTSSESAGAAHGVSMCCMITHAFPPPEPPLPLHLLHQVILV